MSTYTVLRDDPLWEVKFSYDADAVAAAKLHGGRWRPSSRSWTFDDERSAGGFVAELRRMGYRRLGEDAAPPRPAPGITWAEAMFTALPAHLHEPAYRALVRVLHPDVGGDRRAAQVLNDARRTVAA